MKTEGNSKLDISRNLNRLLDEVHDKPEENLIETLAIRSMQKPVIRQRISAITVWLLNIIHTSPRLSAVIRI